MIVHTQIGIYNFVEYKKITAWKLIACTIGKRKKKVERRY
jgi:hypothetical protein